MLQLLADNPEGMRLSDIAERLDISKSSAHLLLATLVEYGFIDRLSAGEYRLGFGAFEVGLAVPEAARFGILAGPLKELADLSGESVSFAVQRGTDAVIVQRYESNQVLRAEIRIGTRMPLYACASGKYLLAHMSDAEIDRLYPSERLKGGAEASYRTKTELKRCFPDILAAGYATQFGEFVDGVDGIATGVRARNGKLLGAVSIAAPSSRFDVDRWKDQLLQAAAAMSSRVRMTP